MRLVLLILLFGSYSGLNLASAAEFEVGGNVVVYSPNARTHTTNAGPASAFRISVKDCQWLIHLDEQSESWEGNAKREIGSANGLEIFELDEALERPGVIKSKPDLSKIGPELKLGPVYTGTMVSNNVHVPPALMRVSGHLWLAFASACYFPSLKTNELTPVYDPSAAAKNNANIKRKAKWSLLNGEKSLPREVSFFREDGTLEARYQALETTNISGVVVPMKILFERFEAPFPVGQIKEAKLIRSALITVNSVRPICSITNFLPEIPGLTVITDFRTSGPANVYKSDHWVGWIEGKKLARDVQKNVSALLPELHPTGPWTIEGSDLFQIQLQPLGRLLFEQPDEIGKFLSENLSDATLQLFKKSYLDSKNNGYLPNYNYVKYAVVPELNNLIYKEVVLFDPARFKSIRPGYDTLALLAKSKRDKPDPRLNRMLLEDAISPIPRSYRLYADPGIGYMVCVDYRKRTLQFYDEEGKKGGFVDFTRNVQSGFGNGGISYLDFGPNAIQVAVDRDVFEVFVNPLFVRYRGRE
jgi:hypothetical protein